MSIDPKWRFAISIVVTVAIGISQGTLVLTNAIPAAYIPIVRGLVRHHRLYRFCR